MLPILFVVFQTGCNTNGGVESITQIVQRYMGGPAIVITQIKTAVNQRWQAMGATVKVWPIAYAIGSSFYRSGWGKKGQRLLSLLQTNLKMYQLVKSGHFPVVHCNDPDALWHTAFGAKLAGARVIFNIRGTKADHEFYDWKWQVSFWLSDRQLVLSQEMRECLIQRLRIPQKHQDSIEAIYSIVDPTHLHPVSSEQRRQIRDRLGIHPETFALGYVALCRPLKAQLNLIEQAVPALKQELPNFKLYLIGDFEPDVNPYAQQCWNAVQRLGLEETVQFVGYTPQVADWYQALDLGISVSQQEGLARCMIESVACGLPFVAFKVCSAAEILVNHDCGRVVPQGSYRELVHTIVKLAQDPVTRQHLSRNGVQTAQQRFQPEPIVRQYEELYHRLARVQYDRPTQVNQQTLPQSSLQ